MHTSQIKTYTYYKDFKNAFGSLNHARLFAIIKYLGYPIDAVALIGNMYSYSHTIITDEHLEKTKPIPIQRGIIQRDIFSSFLFIIYLELLLRWLQNDPNGYSFQTSNITISFDAYANDLAAIANNLQTL